MTTVHQDPTLLSALIEALRSYVGLSDLAAARVAHALVDWPHRGRRCVAVAEEYGINVQSVRAAWDAAYAHAGSGGRKPIVPNPLPMTRDQWEHLEQERVLAKQQEAQRAAEVARARIEQERRRKDQERRVALCLDSPGAAKVCGVSRDVFLRVARRLGQEPAEVITRKGVPGTGYYDTYYWTPLQVAMIGASVPMRKAIARRLARANRTDEASAEPTTVTSHGVRSAP